MQLLWWHGDGYIALYYKQRKASTTSYAETAPLHSFGFSSTDCYCH